MHTERWTHSWLNNVQNVAFLFWSYFDYIMLYVEKIYQALPAIYIRIPGESLGTRLQALTVIQKPRVT